MTEEIRDPNNGMQFGIMFFAASEDALSGARYDLVIESARFADKNGLSSVWVPERHFTTLGCLYPNPAVLQAALARETRRLRLQAGSVVLPLHDPLRVAEEWSVVDNLSGGRVGISFASGWNPNDFAFFPERYRDRHEELFRSVEIVRRLWRGESVPVRSGAGKMVDVRIFPIPVQPELPVWITAAGNPATFARAGAIGANLLTHLLDQDAEHLATKIALYRESRASHGHDPAAGRVTIMLHTFIGENLDDVREEVRAPYCGYLKEHALPLLRELALSRDRKLDPDTLSSEDLDSFAGFLFERFFSTRALLGTPESCLPLIAELRRSGVDEIACLLDFGPPAATILRHLPYLQLLAERVQDAGARAGVSTVSTAAPSFAVPEAPEASIEEIRARCSEEIAGPAFYRALVERGVQLDGSFHGIVRLWRGDGEALAQVRPTDLPDGYYQIHPVVLDSCFQALGGALPNGVSPETLYVPVKLRGFEVFSRPEGLLWSHARITSSGAPGGEMEGSIRILDEAGRLVARAAGLRLRPTARQEAAPSGVSGLLYRTEWEPKPLDPAKQRNLDGTWLICSDTIGVGARLSQLLSDRGVRCVAPSHDGFFAGGELPEAERVEQMRREIDHALAEAGGQLRGVVHLRALDVEPASSVSLAELQSDYCGAAGSGLALIQALARQGTRAPIWFVTRGAQVVASSNATPEPSHSPVWGLARSCAVEHPDLWGGLIDLDPEGSLDDCAAHILEELGVSGGEDQVAFRDGKRYGARLAGIRLESTTSFRLRPDATYLITGGLGGLGLEVAEWMARSGARNLVLASRNAPAERAAEVLVRLEQAGIRVVTIAADVSREPEVASVLATIASSMPPLRGIVHAAGVLNDALLVHQGWEGFARVRAAKVDGSWILHTLTRNLDLDFFVLFSSGSTVMPAHGQANYVAANAFLDGLACYRRSLGLPALSIGWGPWARVGHAATEYGQRAHARLALRGIEQIDPRHGLEALERLIPQSMAHVGVFNIDWRRLVEREPALRRSPFLERCAGHNGHVKKDVGGPVATELLERLRRAGRSARLDILVNHVREQVVHVLGLQSSSALEADRGLFDFGMDSVTALELKNRLQNELGRAIPATLVFDHPSVTRIAGYLASVLQLDDSPIATEPAIEAPHPLAGRAEAIETLSDEETELLLIEKLTALQRDRVVGGDYE